MTILTIICSQSATDASNATRWLNRFHVKLPHAIPVRGRCQLVEYTVLSRSSTIADHHKVIEVDVPWLDCSSTHIIGCGFNEKAENVQEVVLRYDKSRHTSKNMLLTCLTQHVIESPNDMKFITNTTTIPSEFDVTIKSGIDGEAYTNVMFLMMKFSIEVAGLF